MQAVASCLTHHEAMRVIVQGLVLPTARGTLLSLRKNVSDVPAARGIPTTGTQAKRQLSDSGRGRSLRVAQLFFRVVLVGNRFPPKRSAKASASSDLKKENTRRSPSSRRRQYVSGVADTLAATPRTSSVFFEANTFSAGKATWCGHSR